MIGLKKLRKISFGPTGVGAIEWDPGSPGYVKLFSKMGVLRDTEIPCDHTTGHKAWLDARISRETARSTWDGNPDEVLSLQAQDWSAGSGIGGLRCAMFKNRTGDDANIMWMRTVDIEMDNRGTLADRGVALRIGVRSNNPNVTTGIAGLELEMLGQAAPAGYERAIDLIHNDASSVTYPSGIVLRGARDTNGFVFALETRQYGLDKKGAASADSALMKLFDDGENADVANAISGTIVGAVKVVVGSTVGYIPLHDGYTPA